MLFQLHFTFTDNSLSFALFLSSFTGFLLDGETYQNLKDPWWRQSVRDWALMEQNSSKTLLFPWPAHLSPE
jgi:hypothetical protein